LSEQLPERRIPQLPTPNREGLIRLWQWLRKRFSPQELEAGFKRSLQVVSIIFCAYIAASMVSSMFVGMFMGSALKPRNQRGGEEGGSVGLSSNVNYRDLKKAIFERNIFSSEGKFPDESEAVADAESSAVRRFDPNAACQKPKMALELVGTIFMGGAQDSIATVKESGYEEVDVYRAGDKIIGNDQAVVYAVERNMLIINNAGVKECLERVLPSSIQAVLDKTTAPSTPGAPVATTVVADAGGPCASGVTLEPAYVESQLGAGFSKVTTAARMVPNTEGSVTNGYRIFAIDKSSIMGKMCLENNDVITAVNDISLRSLDQGFALFQALQDEREIRIQILRDNVPQTINVRIR